MGAQKSTIYAAHHVIFDAALCLILAAEVPPPKHTETDGAAPPAASSAASATETDSGNQMVYPIVPTLLHIFVLCWICYIYQDWADVEEQLQDVPFTDKAFTMLVESTFITVSLFLFYFYIALLAFFQSFCILCAVI